MKLEYIKIGGYLIPNLGLNEQPTQPICKYGRMWKTYLQEHRPALFYSLLLSEKLYSHLLEMTRPPMSVRKLIDMDYISEKVSFGKWGISERRIQKSCEENRIPGVVKFSHMWLITKDVKKPIDGRLKERKKTQDEQDLKDKINHSK